MLKSVLKNDKKTCVRQFFRWSYFRPMEHRYRPTWPWDGDSQRRYRWCGMSHRPQPGCSLQYWKWLAFPSSAVECFWQRRQLCCLHGKNRCLRQLRARGKSYRGVMVFLDNNKNEKIRETTIIFKEIRKFWSFTICFNWIYCVELVYYYNKKTFSPEKSRIIS